MSAPVPETTRAAPPTRLIREAPQRDPRVRIPDGLDRRVRVPEEAPDGTRKPA